MALCAHYCSMTSWCSRCQVHLQTVWVWLQRRSWRRRSERRHHSQTSQVPRDQRSHPRRAHWQARPSLSCTPPAGARSSCTTKQNGKGATPLYLVKHRVRHSTCFVDWRIGIIQPQPNLVLPYAAWTQVPGKPFQDGTGEFAGSKVVTVEGNNVEFVVTNGEGGWDTPNPAAGPNYRIDGPGVYLLKSGSISKKQ